jgi:hypothetical protein
VLHCILRCYTVCPLGTTTTTRGRNGGGVLPKNVSGTQRAAFARDHLRFFPKKKIPDCGSRAGRGGQPVPMSAVLLAFAVERVVEAPVVLFAS